MRKYELMTIHRPELAEEDLQARVGDIESFLAGKGATLTRKDVWGKRRFAYPIKHLTEGYYSVFNFDAEAALVTELDRMLSLSDEVVRHKIVRPEG